MSRRGVIVSAFVAVHLGVFLWFVLDRSSGTAAAWTGFPLDDAWIHLVYARNIAAHGVPSYNLGTAEAGMSAPLWVLVLAVLHLGSQALSIGIVPLVKVAGLGAGVLASVGAWRLLAALGAGEAAGIAAGLLLGVDPMFNFAEASGMEVPLVVALMLLALDALARRNWRPLGWYAAGALLSRPEAAVLCAGLALVLLVERLRGRVPGRALLLGLGPAVLAGGLVALYCAMVTGRPLPNTFYVKGSWHGLLPRDTLVQLGGMLGDLPYTSFLVGPALAALGAFALLRRSTERAAAVLAVVCGPVFLYAVALSRPLGQNVYYWYRYVQPAMPLLLVLLAAGGHFLARAAWYRRPWLVLPALAVLVLPLVRLPAALADKASVLSWNCQNINEVQVALGRWVAHNVPRDEAVATMDAGALKYFGNHTTIDLMGLNTHQMLPGREEEAQALLDRSRVTTYVVFPWFQGIGRNPAFTQVYGLASPHYTIVVGPQSFVGVYRRR